MVIGEGRKRMSLSLLAHLNKYSNKCESYLKICISFTIRYLYIYNTILSYEPTAALFSVLIWNGTIFQNITWLSSMDIGHLQHQGEELMLCRHLRNQLPHILKKLCHSAKVNLGRKLIPCLQMSIGGTLKTLHVWNSLNWIKVYWNKNNNKVLIDIKFLERDPTI